MKHRGLGWLFGILFVLAAWFVGCSPRTQHIVIDPPRTWARVDWDTFIEGLPGEPGQVESRSNTSSATTGQFDVTIFRDKRIVLPDGVTQIYASRNEEDGLIAYDVQFSWGSQKGSDAQRLFRELIAQFRLTDGKSSIGPAWFGSLRVSDTCEYSVLAQLSGDGGVRSVTVLSFSTTNGPEAPVCG